MKGWAQLLKRFLSGGGKDSLQTKGLLTHYFLYKELLAAIT
jgi:hypothetical protein